MKHSGSLIEETAKILKAAPDKRVHELIDSPLTAQILEHLPIQDAYFMVKDAFGSDSSIVLAYTPTDKIVSFIDLDCWDRDNLDQARFVEWISELGTASQETLLRTLEALDPEIIVLLFQPVLNVFITQPTDDNIPELIENGYETFDNNYFFAFSEVTDETSILRNILEILFFNGQDLFYRILEGVRWELPSDMEERAYQQRILRLMESGFPPSDESRSVYQHAKPDRILKRGLRSEQVPDFGDEEYFIPSLYREEFDKGALIPVKNEEINHATEQRFLFEMVYLANMIAMADYQPLNDSQALRASIDKASALTALGLAIAHRERKESYQDILESMNAQTLFSLGYNSLRELRESLKGILAGVESHMIPTAYREITEELLKKNPTYKGRNISSIQELDDVQAAIQHLDALHRIIRHISWKGHTLTLTNIGIEGLDMENIILTALVVNIISGDFLFRPLNTAELIQFLARTTEVDQNRRQSKPGFQSDLEMLLSSLDQTIPAARIAAVAEKLISRWEDEIAGIDDLERIDPRYLTCVVVALRT